MVPARNLFFFLFFVIIIVNGYGQTLQQPLAGGYYANNAYSKKKADIFSTIFNQASLANLQQATAGIYNERRFLLNDLSVYLMAVALPTSSGNFGVNAFYSGSNAANNSGIGLAYGRLLGEKVAVGLQFDYSSIHLQGYGNADAINVQAGAFFQLTEKLTAGIHAKNFTGGDFGKYNGEKINAIYTAGFGYDVSDQFFLATSIKKEEGFPVNIITGFEYRFHPAFNVKGGVETATSIIYAGAGIQLMLLRLNLICSYHPTLGITPGLGLSINFKQKED